VRAGRGGAAGVGGKRPQPGGRNGCGRRR
jgi:hypothetical protein